MKFTIDVIKENAEPLNLFFHSWEHDGKEIDADLGVVRYLAIAVKKAIRSVLFVKTVKSMDELKAELQKRETKSGTKVNVEMTLNDAMHIVGAFSPNSKFCDGRMTEKAKKAVGRMETQVDHIVEGLDNEAKGKFH